jgi:hypothetical protein
MTSEDTYIVPCHTYHLLQYVTCIELSIKLQLIGHSPHTLIHPSREMLVRNDCTGIIIKCSEGGMDNVKVILF